MHYEFRLPKKISVAAIFENIYKKLQGDITMYGGSSGGETLEGNTFLAILEREKNSEYIKRLYHVNPHAGEFATVTTEQTNRVTITPIDGRRLTDREIRSLKSYLENL